MSGAVARSVLLLALCGWFLTQTPPAHAQISKGNQVLLTRGIQLQGMVTSGDVFHLSTYTNAGFTSINWIWNSSPSQMGQAPGFPWSRWVQDETNMPGPPNWNNETPYLSQLVMLQLGDEWDINTDSVRTRLVNWFNSVRANWPNTILYHNNWCGQASDAALGDFIARAHPDMMSFDEYPFQSDYTTHVPLSFSPNFSVAWYSELRRYRQWGINVNMPFGIYRQTFHAVQDYNTTIYRDPSPSELRLNTSAALLFNAKAFIDFTYNTGASSLFTTPGGDTYPTGLYGEQQDANRRASNLGKALACLKPIYDLHNTNDVNPPPGPGSTDPSFPDGTTTSILCLKGKYLSGGVTNFTAVPIGFQSDPQAPNSYTWWEFALNDPYLAGWVVTNKAGIKNNGLPGEAFIAWFKPLDDSFDGPAFTNEVYFMVVNALSDTNGTAADCLQEIKLNFLNTFSSVVMLDPESGLLQTNTLPLVNTRRQLVLDLNGGDAALFKISDGAPFVGCVTPTPARLSATSQGTGLTLTTQGAVGAKYQVQYSPTLSAATWTVLTNVYLPASPWVFEDSNPANTAGGYYRVVGIP